MQIHQLIQKYRLHARLSREELGERAGINPVLIDRLEAGQPVDGRAIMRLAQFLRIPNEEVHQAFDEGPIQAPDRQTERVKRNPEARQDRGDARTGSDKTRYEEEKPADNSNGFYDGSRPGSNSGFQGNSRPGGNAANGFYGNGRTNDNAGNTGEPSAKYGESGFANNRPPRYNRAADSNGNAGGQSFAFGAADAYANSRQSRNPGYAESNAAEAAFGAADAYANSRQSRNPGYAESNAAEAAFGAADAYANSRQSRNPGYAESNAADAAFGAGRGYGAERTSRRSGGFADGRGTDFRQDYGYNASPYDSRPEAAANFDDDDFAYPDLENLSQSYNGYREEGYQDYSTKSYASAAPDYTADNYAAPDAYASDEADDYDYAPRTQRADRAEYDAPRSYGNDRAYGRYGRTVQEDTPHYDSDFTYNRRPQDSYVPQYDFSNTETAIRRLAKTRGLARDAVRYSTALDAAVDAARLRGRELVLEIGCGRGDLTEKLLDRAGFVVALDSSVENLDRVAAKAYAMGAKNIDLVAGDARRLPVEAVSFDVVYINFALHNTLEPELVIAEAYRVLKPGGRLVVAELAAAEGQNDQKLHDAIEILANPSHAKFLTSSEIAYMLRDEGFSESGRRVLDQQWGFDEWVSSLGIPEGRVNPIYELMRSLALQGNNAGMDLDIDNRGRLSFIYRWLIFTAVKGMHR